MDNCMDNETLPVKFTERHLGYARGFALPEGTKQAKQSFYLGVLGLFVMGIFIGFLAVLYAHRAEKIGVRATAGKVLGYLDILFGIVFAFLVLEVVPHLI